MKTSKCKFCQKEFIKTNPLVPYCSPRCADKKRQEKEKTERKKKREKKRESITTTKKALWTIISQYIRRKYAGPDGLCSCVTCPTVKHWKELQAGHFIPSGSSSYFRYVEYNIHPQCYHCNLNLGSNPIEYRIFMDKTYGKEFVEEMISKRREIKSLQKYDLDLLIEEYKAKLESLK